MSVNLMSAIFETEFFDLKDEEGNTTKASTAKLVLLAMADHANDEGEGAYPSIERLGRKTALSEQTIRNTFDALRYNGIISLEGRSKYGTNNHTINTKSFPKAIGKEVTRLTLYPLDPQMSNETPSNEYTPLTYSLDPNQLTINKTSTEDIPQNMPLDWYIQHDYPVPAELIESNQLEKSATSTFEEKLGFGSLPWDSTNEWTTFKKWVMKIHQADETTWQRYAEWRADKGKYDAMSNKQIRQNPKMFIDTGYPAFMAHSVMYQQGGRKPHAL